MGPDARWQPFRWQPFRCSSGAVGYLRSPACPGGGLQDTVPVKSRCGGCRLGSRWPPGGAVATRPPSLLPRSGVAPVIQWSAASDGSALATHPSPGGPPGRHHRELPGPCLRGDPAEIYRSSALSLHVCEVASLAPLGSPCGHSSAPGLLGPSLCSESHQALEFGAQHIQVPSLVPSELATSPSSLPSLFSARSAEDCGFDSGCLLSRGNALLCTEASVCCPQTRSLDTPTSTFDLIGPNMNSSLLPARENLWGFGVPTTWGRPEAHRPPASELGEC